MKEQETTVDSKLCELLKANVDTFDPFFTTRVMARVQTTTTVQEAWAAGIGATFRRVAVAACLAAGILIAHNISSQWEYRHDSSAIEMTLGIPPATFATSVQLVGLWL
jgi:hypothetical protein